ncbi:MAG: SH3 domain-containing protein [Leptolyngbyaceae cyanobacterium bins.349]|nr:SH3 domain-containing protein [Leptolyngbyaceae cyanobacterium bins.349]
MTTSNLVHISNASKNASSTVPFPLINLWIAKISGIGCWSFLSLVLATMGLGVAAERSAAQVIYYPRERQISISTDSGVVSTNSRIGLNVRSGPGLRFPIIGGADDGNFLQLVGSPVFADGYRWQQVSTGGWVASDFVSGGVVNVSISDGCLREISACGGDSQPIDRPISIQPPLIVQRPISVAAGPYVAAIPGGTSTLSQVRRVVPGAQLDRAREGSFVNAGGFATHDGAQAMTSFLRANGFDARVIFK